MSKTDSKTRLRQEVRDRLALVEKSARDGVDLFAQDIRALYENEFMLADQLDRLDLRTAVMVELIGFHLGITDAEFAERYVKVKAEKEARREAAQAKEDEERQAAMDKMPIKLPTDMPDELARVAAAGGDPAFPEEAFIFGGKS